MGKHRKTAGRKTALDARSADELATLGEQFLDEGNFPEAQKHLTASLAKQQNARVMFSLAGCLLELNKPQEAKQHLVRSCELEPNCQPEKWLSLAELEQGKESLRCLRKAIEILERELHQPVAMDEDENADEAEDKENAEKPTLRKLSNAYVCVSELYTTDLCDEPEAEETVKSSIQKAIELDPQNSEAFQAKAAYHLIKQEFEVAKQDMKKSLDLWLPSFEKVVEGADDQMIQVPAFNVRLSGVKLLLELEMHDEAVNVLDGLVLEDEECVDVWYLLGWTNYLQGVEYQANSKFYLRKAKKVATEYECDDEAMVAHIDELLLELKDVETDDEDERDDDAEWETDDD